MLKFRPFSYIKGIIAWLSCLHAKRHISTAKLVPKCYLHDDHPTSWSFTKENLNGRTLTEGATEPHQPGVKILQPDVNELYKFSQYL